MSYFVAVKIPSFEKMFVGIAVEQWLRYPKSVNGKDDRLP